MLYNAEINKEILEKDKRNLESLTKKLLSNMVEGLEKDIVNIVYSSKEEEISKNIQELIGESNNKLSEVIKEIVENRDKYLCEQLYIFLNNYVNSRLIYENMATKEDFIQDSMLFLLERFNSLSKEEKETLNLEKFFFNRARSFIGERLRRRSEAKRRNKELRDDVLYLEATNKATKEVEYVDDYLLDKLIKKYSLNKDKSKTLRELSINRLVKLGYSDKYTKFDDSYLESTLNKLSLAVVDEYLLLSVQVKQREVTDDN